MRLLCLAIGMCMGLFFYTGLFWTIKKGLQSRHAGLFFVLSFFVRIGSTIGVFALVSQGDIIRILMCTVGFAFSRFAVGYSLKKEATYENNT